MDNLTYIIPLNEFNETVETLLERALKSVNAISNTKKTRIIMVGPNEVLGYANAVCTNCKCKQTIIPVENNDTDFNVQINKAVMQCTSEYFTILEFDDAFYPYWTKCIDEYINAGEASSIYMPIVEIVDNNNLNEPITTVNEIALANSFTNDHDLGLLDNDALEDYIEFNVTGSIIKTEDFISVGGLKPSLKVASWYEFLMRMAYNHKIIRVIPKIGYIHTIGRDTSYTEIMRKEIDNDYAEWLLKTARQEYFFKEDRNIEYEK